MPIRSNGRALAAVVVIVGVACIGNAFGSATWGFSMLNICGAMDAAGPTTLSQAAQKNLVD